jgi:AraC-like DNA-binding protein
VIDQDRYVCRNAAPALPNGISGVWARHSDGRQPIGERYAPADACAHLLVGFGAARAGQRDLVHVRLIGPRTRPFLIDDSPQLCVGVRVVPGFAQKAFGMDASELLDQRVDYDLVYKHAEADFDCIRTAGTDTDRVAAVLAIAQGRLRATTPIAPSLRAAMAHITVAEGNLRISSLADHLGVTRQHLARQFAAHVGMTIKQFARIKRAEGARARAMAAELTRRGSLNWSMIAHQAGYYDQAHFIRDFKALTGMTPGEWMR